MNDSKEASQCNDCRFHSETNGKPICVVFTPTSIDKVGRCSHREMMSEWRVVIHHAIFQIGIVEDGEKLIQRDEYNFAPGNENCYSRLLEKYQKEVKEHNTPEEQR